MRFSGKTVVVTGGASGIGLASAKRFHAEGASLVIADLNTEQGEAVAAELGDGRCVFRKVDVSDFGEVEALMQHAEATFGGLDILFNNAGIGALAQAPDLSVEEWRRVLDVDLSGVFYGCKAAIPLMRKRGGGAIVNTASASGLAADFGFVVYNAAKGGVVNLTRAVAIDHAPENIRVNAVCPGPIETAIIAGTKNVPGLRDDWNERVPMGRFGAPEEVASVVCFLASDDASFVTGSIVSVDGGMMAHTGQPNLPKTFAKLAGAQS